MNSFDAQVTYGAAAPVYDDAANRYWGFSGERTVERLALFPGARILDVACGTGTSAIPAAQAVAPNGSVLALDYAEPMLDVARAKAEELELTNIEFRVADMTRLDLPEAPFDAVVCVLGLFFVDDMKSQIADLWNLVAPGGKLAITTLGPHAFSPLIDEWRTSVEAVEPGHDLSMPWQRTDDPQILAGLLADSGVANAAVELEQNQFPLGSPDDAWQLVMGSGLRSVTTALGDDTEIVRRHIEEWVTGEGPLDVSVPIIYATAGKSLP